MFRFGLVLLLVGMSHSTWAQTCEFDSNPPGLGLYELERVHQGFARPIAMESAPGVADGFFVVEQAGKIVKVVDSQKRVVLDITDRVFTLQGGNDERGLLGLIFHPKFAQNGRLFVNYTKSGSADSVISEFKMVNGAISPSSEKIVLEVDQTEWNHNGGGMAFGPDGYLYLGFGDGGGAGDRPNNAQNLRLLLGKILRIDVDRGSPYSIPSDNPRFNRSDARGEIFAYGIRNPWRMSFDEVTGELYVGDVGQNAWEEVSIIKKGGNHGWRVMEGNACYNPRTNCNREGLINPIHTYPHSEGVSITGGYVYRGTNIPELIGTYVYGDFSSGTIWGLKYVEGQLQSNQVLVNTNLNISSFGLHKGDLYVVDFRGSIYKLNKARSQVSNFPLKISETGCFKSLSPLSPASGVVPYEVNAPLWSDNASKNRFVYVPQGREITYRDGQPFSFPVGTVLIKNFSLPIVTGNTVANKIVETRFFVKRPNRFDGYSYMWDEDGRDGTFLSGGIKRDFEVAENGRRATLSYLFPSSSSCKRCHTTSVGEALGFAPEQLNLEQSGQNQLESLSHLGVITGLPTVSQIPRLANYTSSTFSLTDRARSYLHANCAHCHNPTNNSGQIPMDLRYDTPVGDMDICNTLPRHGNLNVTGSRLLVAGDSSKSLISLRQTTTDPGTRMPPLATVRIDPLGTQLVDDWIDRLSTCP